MDCLRKAWIHGLRRAIHGLSRIHALHITSTLVLLRTNMEMSCMHTVFYVLLVMAKNTKLATGICIRPFLERVKPSTEPLRRTTRSSSMYSFLWAVANVVMQCLTHSECGRATVHRSRIEKTTWPAHRRETATKALDRECTGLISSFFSRAPSDVKICTNCVLSERQKSMWEYVKVTNIRLFLNCRQLLTTMAIAPR